MSSISVPRYHVPQLRTGEDIHYIGLTSDADNSQSV